MVNAKQRLAWRLRCLADRIDHRGAPKHISSLTFTFEAGVGVVVHARGPAALRMHENGQLPGCSLWYLGDDDYERAHEDGSA